MSIVVWYFERIESGLVRGVPRAAVEAFTDGARPMRPAADGFVHLIEVVVELQGGIAQEVVRVVCFKHRADSDGMLDREHLHQMMGAMAEAAMPDELVAAQPGVISAEKRFAQRRLEHSSKWQMSLEETRALKSLVNRKARRRLV